MEALEFLGFIGREAIEQVYFHVEGHEQGTFAYRLPSQNFSFQEINPKQRKLQVIFPRSSFCPEIDFIRRGQDYKIVQHCIFPDAFLEAFVEDPREVRLVHRSGIPFKLTDENMRVEEAEASGITIGFWKPDSTTKTQWIRHVDKITGDYQYRIIENSYKGVKLEFSNNLKNKYLRFSYCKIVLQRYVFPLNNDITGIKLVCMGDFNGKTKIVVIKGKIDVQLQTTRSLSTILNFGNQDLKEESAPITLSNPRIISSDTL